RPRLHLAMRGETTFALYHCPHPTGRLPRVPVRVPLTFDRENCAHHLQVKSEVILLRFCVVQRQHLLLLTWPAGSLLFLFLPILGLAFCFVLRSAPQGEG